MRLAVMGEECKMSEKLEVGGADLGRINRRANKRKTEFYWLGFLEGTMASGRIEHAEVAPLKAEAEAFARFFNDPDAKDLVLDIAHVHGVLDNDLYEQLDDIVSARRKLAIAETDLSDKDRMNEFLGFCAGVICDGEVLEAEAKAIVRRFAADPALTKNPHLVNLRSTLDETLADNVLNGKEAEDVKDWITRVVGDGYVDTGLPSIGSTTQLPGMLADHREIVFPERIFVVTGALRIAPRRTLAELVRARGGVFSEHITLETHYLVVAPTASRDWRATHFGTKIETAQKYISQGAPLQFVPEHVFEEALR